MSSRNLCNNFFPKSSDNNFRFICHQRGKEKSGALRNRSYDLRYIGRPAGFITELQGTKSNWCHTVVCPCLKLFVIFFFRRSSIKKTHGELRNILGSYNRFSKLGSSNS